MVGDKKVKEAYSVGIALFHEVAHKLYSISDEPNGLHDPGPLERTYINPIRAQLGLPEREFYTAQPVPTSLRAVFPKDVYLNFKIGGKDKMLRWQHDLVGGKLKH
jgi:hypothetical protein